jgi:dTDP-4-amino-4,6-dideoxygalactose transaminase
VRDADTARRLREIARSEPSKSLGWLAKRLAKTSFEATVTDPLVLNLGVYPALRLLEGRNEKGERFASGYQRDEVTLQGRMGRFTNYQAKLGLAQTDHAVALLDRRVANARRLMARLERTVRFQSNDSPEVESNYMLLTALFPNMKEVARELLRAGVDTKHHYMRDCSALLDDDSVAFSRAAQAEREVLHLPAYPELSIPQIDRSADRIEKAVATVGAQGT